MWQEHQWYTQLLPAVPIFHSSYPILMSSVINYWKDPQQNWIYLLNGRLEWSCVMKLNWGMASFTIQHSNKFSKLSHNNKLISYDQLSRSNDGFLHRTFSDSLQVVIHFLPHHLNYQHTQVWSSASHFLLREINENNTLSAKHTYKII